MQHVKEATPESNREYVCNGGCCERFYLYTSVENLWGEYEKAIIEDVKADILIIAPMVIPIEEVENGQWAYTCRHWDTETRLCRIYDKRPTMCKNYPYGNVCSYCDSTCVTEKNTDVLPPGPVNIDVLNKRRKDDKRIGTD